MRLRGRRLEFRIRVSMYSTYICYINVIGELGNGDDRWIDTRRGRGMNEWMDGWMDGG